MFELVLGWIMNVDDELNIETICIFLFNVWSWLAYEFEWFNFHKSKNFNDFELYTCHPHPQSIS